MKFILVNQPTFLPTMKTSLLLWLFATATFCLQAQWKELGPQHLPIESLAGSGDTLFASSMHGFYRSTDGGDQWDNLTSPFAFGNFSHSFFQHDIIIQGSNVFAIEQNECAGRDVYLSSDLGQSWGNLGLHNHPDYYGYPEGMLLSGNRILLAAKDRVWRSDDEGSTWTNTIIPGETVVELFLFNQQIIALTFSEKVLISNDNGGSFQPYAGGNLPTIPASGNGRISFASKGPWLFAAVPGKGVYASKNYGNWVLRSTNLPSNTCNGLVLYQKKLYLSMGTEGVYVSSNNGLTFQYAGLASSAVGDEREGVMGLSIANNKLYACGFNGIHEKAPGNNSWTSKSNGLAHARIDYVYKLGSDLVGGGADVLECAGDFSYNNLLFKGNNPFKAWDQITRTSFGIVRMHQQQGDTLLLATDDGICQYFYAYDPAIGFLTYEEFPDNGCFFPALGRADVQSMAIIGEYIFYADGGTGFYQSSNRGLNVSFNNSLIQNVLALSAKGNRLFANTSTGIFVSSDLGITWTATTQMPDNYHVSGEVVQAKQVQYRVANGEVEYSFDQGNNWQILAGSSTWGTLTGAIAVGGNDFLYVGTEGRGIFRHNLLKNPLFNSSRQAPSGMPGSESDLQVFPNPTQAHIRVRSEQVGTVTLMTLAGKTLETHQHQGRESRISLEHLPAGSYLLQLQHKQGIDTKLILKQ